jgi:uncharacterized cupredoxin-like copper-binding protein
VLLAQAGRTSEGPNTEKGFNQEEIAMTATPFVTARHMGTTLYLSGATLALAAVAGRIRPTTPALTTLRIVAHDYSYELPATVGSGPVRIELVNEGKELHQAYLVRLEQGKTLRDLAQLPAEAPPPSWMVPLGGPNAAEPGDSSRVIENLAPGNYAVICVIPSPDGTPHFMKGMATGFEVKSRGGTAARAPKADLTIRLADFAFALSAPVKPGNRTINVVNDAVQPHEVVLVRLAEGKTAADLVQWSQAHFDGPPPGHFVGGIVGLASGASGMVEATFEPGNYALICYFPDVKDGLPHFAHGMVAPLTVAPAS